VIGDRSVATSRAVDTKSWWHIRYAARARLREHRKAWELGQRRWQHPRRRAEIEWCFGYGLHPITGSVAGREAFGLRARRSSPQTSRGREVPQRLWRATAAAESFRMGVVGRGSFATRARPSTVSVAITGLRTHDGPTRTTADDTVRSGMRAVSVATSGPQPWPFLGGLVARAIGVARTGTSVPAHGPQPRRSGLERKLLHATVASASAECVEQWAPHASTVPCSSRPGQRRRWLEAGKRAV
jgi:hypothetical protein